MRGLYPLILTVAVLTVFSPALSHHFVNLDDPNHLLFNENTKSLDIQNIKDIFVHVINGTYIPLTVLSFAVEYHFFKLNPFFYHFHNILLHLFVSLCVYFFAQQCGLDKLKSFISALLFAVHPMHVESVAWVTERKDVLYASFYLSALLCYCRYITSKRKDFYYASVVFGFLSMLSKPMALSLPVVCLCLDWYKARKFEEKLFYEKIPYLLYIIPLLLITYSFHPREFPETILSGILLWVWSFVFYIRQFIFPVDVNPFYAVPHPVDINNINYLLSVVVFFIFLVCAVLFRRHKIFTLAWLYYFVSIFFLLRVNASEDLHFVADRFMYLPSLGFCFLFGWFFGQGIEVGNKLRKKFFLFVAAAVFLALSVKTYTQAQIWKDSIKFWSAVLEKRPGLPIAYFNRAEEYRQKGMFNLAIKDFQMAVHFKQDGYAAMALLSKAYVQNGYPQQALTVINNAINLKPDYYMFYWVRGDIYSYMKDLLSALRDYNKSIELNSQFGEVFISRGLIYLKTGQKDLARDDFLYAAEIGHGDTTGYFLSKIY